MKSFSVSVLFFLAFAIFETAVLSNILIIPAIPDFLLICSIYFSIQNGRLFGVSSGFVSGLFLDFLGSGPFGLNCLLRTIIGYAAGFFAKTLNINGLFFPLILGFSGTLLKSLLLWFISMFFPNVPTSISGFFSFRFIIELILNSVLTPITFKFLDIFKNALVLNPEKVS